MYFLSSPDALNFSVKICWCVRDKGGEPGCFADRFSLPPSKGQFAAACFPLREPRDHLPISYCVSRFAFRVAAGRLPPTFPPDVGASWVKKTKTDQKFSVSALYTPACGHCAVHCLLDNPRGVGNRRTRFFFVFSLIQISIFFRIKYNILYSHNKINIIWARFA